MDGTLDFANDHERILNFNNATQADLIFVKILRKDSLISTNDVINSNNCFISICKSKYKDKFIILSAIDNLIKGGAGQAVQNLNMKFNFPVKTAL